MAKEKACKKCKTVFTGTKCTSCESKEITDSWKGKLIVFDPENSEISKNLKITKKGTYAIRT